MTDKSMADRDIGRVRLRFFRNSAIAQANTKTVTTRPARWRSQQRDYGERPRGRPEGLRRLQQHRDNHPRSRPGWARLARASAARPRSHARRLGWLVKHYSESTPDLEALNSGPHPIEALHPHFPQAARGEDQSMGAGPMDQHRRRTRHLSMLPEAYITEWSAVPLAGSGPGRAGLAPQPVDHRDRGR